MEKNMKATCSLAFVLVIIGGLNWLLVGLFSWDVGVIFGGQDVVISRIIYILVGLSAIYLAATQKGCCKHCCEKKTDTTIPSNNPAI